MEADELMRSEGISSLAVENASGECTGVISLSDIIHYGQKNSGRRYDSALLESKGEHVAKVMTPRLLSVEPTCSLADASWQMLDKHVHRVFVQSDNKILGILSTTDVMDAVQQCKINKPVSMFMSSPVFTIRANEPISGATSRLERAHVSGLLVVDESQWPVGVYSQTEAVDAAELPRTTKVEEAMDPSVLTIPANLTMHHAAKQALAMGAKRVAVMNKSEIVGVLTTTDFAKATAS